MASTRTLSPPVSPVIDRILNKPGLSLLPPTVIVAPGRIVTNDWIGAALVPMLVRLVKLETPIKPADPLLTLWSRVFPVLLAENPEPTKTLSAEIVTPPSR